MHNILLQLEHSITAISNGIWPIFLPFMLFVGAFTAIRSIFIVQNQTTNPAKLKLKNIIGPASISLGVMIGTGAIIGVLGALSKYAASGEVNIESMAIWALIGACIMVPVSYTVCFVALAVFGFGGF